ncbi:hypothetical protein [Salinispira pacifica]
MIRTDGKLGPADLERGLTDLFACAAESTHALRLRLYGKRGPAASPASAEAAPVFTVEGRYTSRGWTEWTQGFLFGNAIQLFDATGERELLDYGREGTRTIMASHVSHTGVHDHGFNNLSTYGNLLRLATEGRFDTDRGEMDFYRLALKISGAVQAARWSALSADWGYVYSFNGAHSLFADTIRSMRVLAVAHRLGHTLMSEQDARVNLLRRLLVHAETTARYNVYFGEGRDAYDIRGRVAHESIFNVASGAYRCPSTQQGYSPFSTWTRGLAWILLGFAELCEYLETVEESEIAALELPYYRSKGELLERFAETARATADFYIEWSPTDGVPYWDTGAPGLARLSGWSDRPADPFNRFEPVDSSAAAIAAQGLLRLARHLRTRTDASDRSTGVADAERYQQAGLRTAATLFADPYLARDPKHEGILLHSVYHRPNGWDHVRAGQEVPNGEACMWGDYHALELGVYIKRLIDGAPYLTFFAGTGRDVDGQAADAGEPAGQGD